MKFRNQLHSAGRLHRQDAGHAGRVGRPGLCRSAVQYRLRVRRLRRQARARTQYLDWSRDWIAAVHRVLKPSGTFWLAIGDEYAAELKLASQEIGFHPRSWVIWYYTFGVNCKHKFSRSHAHLFYFVKDPQAVHVSRRRAGESHPFGPATGVRRWSGESQRPPAGRHVGAPAAGPGRLLHAGRRHLVLSPRRRHVQGAGRISRLPDARAAAGPDHPVLLARRRAGARSVQRQRHDRGRGQEARPAMAGVRSFAGVRRARDGLGWKRSAWATRWTVPPSRR